MAAWNFCAREKEKGKRKRGEENFWGREEGDKMGGA